MITFFYSISCREITSIAFIEEMYVKSEKFILSKNCIPKNVTLTQGKWSFIYVTLICYFSHVKIRHYHVNFTSKSCIYTSTFNVKNEIFLKKGPCIFISAN